jgi:hypothetical protein
MVYQDHDYDFFFVSLSYNHHKNICSRKKKQKKNVLSYLFFFFSHILFFIICHIIKKKSVSLKLTIIFPNTKIYISHKSLSKDNNHFHHSMYIKYFLNVNFEVRFIRCHWLGRCWKCVPCRGNQKVQFLSFYFSLNWNIPLIWLLR